ncbi:hypothetical protein K4H28_06150 [Deefgea tanakiae]|uniref:Uncharacterized protein n=1 Tax=Deefgea tanakiae TaxID=2865840 RepID=A0ABX8ZCS4_9NEIS|nr:hypothetical protein [Deefgea tanakiae]QZA78975.1 hypothetical protein K4H28_06150 [Deefgea tanakiae]
MNASLFRYTLVVLAFLLAGLEAYQFTQTFAWSDALIALGFLLMGISMWSNPSLVWPYEVAKPNEMARITPQVSHAMYSIARILVAGGVVIKVFQAFAV